MIMNSYHHNSDIYCDYICEHVQKITEALYRVTDIFPDREPLKWYLRDEGLVIFKIFMKIKDCPAYNRMKHIDKMERAVPHMLHALALSSSGTFISRTNFEVLSREYNTLLDFIKDKKDEFLPESVKSLSVTPFEERLNGLNSHENAEDQAISDTPAVSPQRKEKILELIHQKGEVSVGDIASFFHGVSEKTIQRDLISLSEQGVLRKYGNKRWRRYVLNHNTL